MSIWLRKLSLAQINELGKGTMVSHIGIEVTEIGDDYLRGRMPVDHRTCQPYGILHGGASVVLAESLASIGAHFTVDAERFQCVGLEINANHVRAVSEGFVAGTSRPVHLGRRTQVWETRIVDGSDRLACISRITMAIIDRIDNNK